MAHEVHTHHGSSFVEGIEKPVLTGSQFTDVAEWAFETLVLNASQVVLQPLCL